MSNWRAADKSTIVDTIASVLSIGPDTPVPAPALPRGGHVAEGQSAAESAAAESAEGDPIVKEFILDQETGRCVAFVLNGEVFRDTREGEKIATVRAGNLYDLNGNLVGHLQGTHVVGLREATMPVPFKKLLESGE